MGHFIITSLRYVFYTTLRFVCTLISRLYLFLIGVDYGRGFETRGWLHVYRRKDSVIKLGENCRFNSLTYYNHIGLNHRCSIATMGRGETSLIIGKNCGISSSSITAFKKIEIGDDVRIGANCVIMDADFHLEDPRAGVPQPIKIGDRVWLGANVVVKKGVTIGKNSIIGMNSVVTKDIPENSVAVGSPAKVIRTLEEDVIRKLERNE